MPDDPGLTEAFSIVFTSLMPPAVSGSVGLARVCTALAEKGVLSQEDILKISFDALQPFDRANSHGDPIIPVIAQTMERLRQSLEGEWDKAMRAAYRAKHPKGPERE